MKYPLHAAAMLAALFLAACSSDNGNKKAPEPKLTNHMAVINMADPSYGDYDLALVDLTADTLTIQEGGYSGHGGDIALTAFGENFYRLGRYNIDRVTKYSIKDPANEIYTYRSIPTSNSPSSTPYDLVFVSEEKAYLIQYEYDKLWIVNPSAATEADFKIGEVDLADFADADGVPEMSAGVIVEGKLYLTLQRLNRSDNSWRPGVATSQVLVINTTTDAVEKAIDLKTVNPLSINYYDEIGVVVTSAGYHYCYACQPKTVGGGIEKIDTTTQQTTVLLSDSASYGFSHSTFASATQAYAVRYNDWGNSDVYAFNPTTGEMAESPLDNLKGLAIRGITVYDDKLWVSIADYSNPRVNLYHLSDETPAGQLATSYFPENIVFIKVYE